MPPIPSTGEVMNGLSSQLGLPHMRVAYITDLVLGPVQITDEPSLSGLTLLKAMIDDGSSAETVYDAFRNVSSFEQDDAREMLRWAISDGRYDRNDDRVLEAAGMPIGLAWMS